MEKKGISQEMLKLTACAAMLLDHIGAMFVPGYGLRIIGRLAFPIFCFLLAEGAEHTKNPRKYGQRLLIGALLAELPFDFMAYGSVSLQHQNVMVTLLVGYLMILQIKKRSDPLLPLLIAFLTAELLCSDYGGIGIAVIWLFTVTSGKPRELLLRTAGLAILFWCMDSVRVTVFDLRIPIQLFGVLAMIPIGLYSGKKLTSSRWIQWAFYLFYPVHMLALLLVERSGL